MLAPRTLHSANITEEALTEAVAPTAAVLAVVAVDSTAATDSSAARVLLAGYQPRHGNGVVVRSEVSVDLVPE